MSDFINRVHPIFQAYLKVILKTEFWSSRINKRVGGERENRMKRAENTGLGRTGEKQGNCEQDRIYLLSEFQVTEKR